jgi:hypothetical protein
MMSTAACDLDISRIGLTGLFGFGLYFPLFPLRSDDRIFVISQPLREWGDVPTVATVDQT